MRLPGTDGAHNRLLIVIPFPGSQSRPLAQPRLGTIGPDHQFGGQRSAIVQLDPGSGTPALHTHTIDHRNVTVCKLGKQSADNRPVLNNGTQGISMKFSRIEVNSPGAVGIPDRHAAIAAMPAGLDMAPGPETIQQLLTGQ